MSIPNGSNQTNPITAENHRMAKEILNLKLKIQELTEENQTLRRERNDAADRLDEIDKQELSEVWGEG